MTYIKLSTKQEYKDYKSIKPTYWGHAVEHLVEVMRYKSEDRGFDSRWCQRNFSFT